MPGDTVRESACFKWNVIVRGKIAGILQMQVAALWRSERRVLGLVPGHFNYRFYRAIIPGSRQFIGLFNALEREAVRQQS